MIRLLTIPFFRFLILFSLVWLALSVVVMVRSRRSTSWPRTVGTIVSTEVKRKVSQSLSNDMPVDSVSYEPYVRYAYSVRDRQYEHDKLTTAVTSMIRESAEAAAILQRYPLGHQQSRRSWRCGPRGRWLEWPLVLPRVRVRAVHGGRHRTHQPVAALTRAR